MATDEVEEEVEGEDVDLVFVDSKTGKEEILGKIPWKDYVFYKRAADSLGETVDEFVTRAVRKSLNDLKEATIQERIEIDDAGVS